MVNGHGVENLKITIKISNTLTVNFMICIEISRKRLIKILKTIFIKNEGFLEDFTLSHSTRIYTLTYDLCTLLTV